MNKQLVLKLGKIEDLQRDHMYSSYLQQLAQKKKSQGLLQKEERSRPFPFKAV